MKRLETVASCRHMADNDETVVEMELPLPNDLGLLLNSGKKNETQICQTLISANGLLFDWVIINFS